MKKSTDEKKVELQINADKQVIAKEAASTRILEICITPPTNDQQKERSPLNLSLVIDRSGSMQGEKLHFAKQAASHMVDLMGDQDKASVTIYDDTVETIFLSEFMTMENKTSAKTRIQTAHSGGSTCLSGGWLRGCEEVAKGAMTDTINRTLLLTDGLANRGITNIDELSTHSRELSYRGISTSCFGVGLGYDEHLLEAISNSGGGNFHYLETMNAIPLEFEREFEELVNISLRDTKVELQTPAGVQAESTAGWYSETVEDRFIVSAGNLYSGKKQALYFKLHFKSNLEGDDAVFQISVKGKDESGNSLEDNKSFSFKIVPSKVESSVEPDKSLMERYVLVDMADRANEALKRERAGDRAGATQIMNMSIDANRKHLSDINFNKFHYMATEMTSGMSEEARKRHHREEYENKRGRETFRDYGLKMINGHLFAEIEGLNVLIDSGAPTSASDAAEWYFLHEVYRLPKGYMGVTLDYLSNVTGARVDILMGTDIMRKYHVTLNLSRNRISFSSRSLLRFDTWLPMTIFMGVPSVSLTQNGNPLPMYIDSGARISYVSQNIASKYTPNGIEKDFYPGMGEFETQAFDIPFQLGSLNFTLRCGVLPSMLESALLLTGNYGIVGSELYQKYIVDLAFPDRAIGLQE
jgi:Ca-activated chloride channel family protein